MKRTRGRVVAGLAVSALLLGPARDARADGWFESPFGPRDGEASTAKKVTVVTLLSASAITYGISFVFLAQANGADTDRRDFITAHGGNPDGGASSGGCRTVDECAQLSKFRQEALDASSRWRTTVAIGGAMLVAGGVVTLLWPNAPKGASARVVPAGSSSAAGLQLEGSF